MDKDFFHGCCLYVWHSFHSTAVGLGYETLDPTYGWFWKLFKELGRNLFNALSKSITGNRYLSRWVACWATGKYSNMWSEASQIHERAERTKKRVGINMIVETMPVWKWKAWVPVGIFLKVVVDKLPDKATTQAKPSQEPGYYPSTQNRIQVVGANSK